MKLFLCGDVMTGRGIDQILPSPCDPALDEPWVKSALDYVAPAELERERPDARIVNLETAVTTSAERAEKGINYRMSPANAACLAAARIDCCVLANNRAARDPAPAAQRVHPGAGAGARRVTVVALLARKGEKSKRRTIAIE